MGELPRVSPFTIPELGLEFVDRREADLETINAAALLFGRHLIVEWREPMGDQAPPGLCSDDVDRENTIGQRFEEWRAETGSEDFEAFEQTGGTVVRQVDRDPRLEGASLIALDASSGEPVGTLGIHNVTPDGRACFLIPGLGAHAGRDRERVWARVALYLLESELELEGGGTLDLEAILLPDDPPEASFSRHDPRGMGIYFDELEAAGARFTESTTRPGAIVRVELGA